MWRYYAYDLVNKVFLHQDVPLEGVEISYALSGPGSINGSLSGLWPDLLNADGTPLLNEWSTLILAEEEGIIRAGGILVNSTFTAGNWDLECTGFTAFPQGQTLEKTYSYKQTSSTAKGVDPITVAKWLWTDGLGYFPNGNLGITFNTATSNYQLGTWTYNTKVTTTDSKGKKVTKTVQATQDINGVGIKPPANVVSASYVLNDYDNVDIGQKISDFAKQTPFDFVEFYGWKDSTKTDVVMRVDFGSPRLGAKKSQLRFVEGENVSEVISVKRDGDDYANGVRVIGAGEGKDQIAVTVTNSDPRLRRVYTYTDQTIKTTSEATSKARVLLAQKQNLVDIQGLTVQDHPNAPIGSFLIGDDIQVQTFTGWEKVSLSVRITGYTLKPESGEIDLTTTRSDSFSYEGTAN